MVLGLVFLKRIVPVVMEIIPCSFLYTAIAGRTFGIGLVAAFYPILLSLTLGRSGLVVGMLFAIPGLAVCLGLPVAGRILGGRSHSVLAFGGLILSAAALYGIGASRELWQFALWGSIMGLGSSVSIPASMTLASRLSPRQGRGFGMAHAASGVGFMAGPLAGGLMVQYAHQLDVVFQLAAFLGIIVQPSFWESVARGKVVSGQKSDMGDWSFLVRCFCLCSVGCMCMLTGKTLRIMTARTDIQALPWGPSST